MNTLAMKRRWLTVRPWAVIAAEAVAIVAFVTAAMSAVQPIGRLICAWVGQ